MKKCTCEKYSFGLVCPSCSDKAERSKFSTYIKETINLEWYGKSSRAQMDELERRVIIKHLPDGGYILGRRGENGKIEERHPNYA